MNRRGVSGVITTLLLITVAIVAVGIVTVVILNVVANSSDDIPTDSFTTVLKVTKAEVISDSMVLTIERKAGSEQIDKFRIVLSDGTSSQEVITSEGLEGVPRRTFNIDLELQPTKIDIYPIRTNDKGEDVVGKLSASSTNIVEVAQTACTIDTECDQTNVCIGHETCDVGAGFCVSGTPLDCDDGNDCTSDSCDPVSGCSNSPISEGTECGGGLECAGENAIGYKIEGAGDENANGDYMNSGDLYGGKPIFRKAGNIQQINFNPYAVSQRWELTDMNQPFPPTNRIRYHIADIENLPSEGTWSNEGLMGTAPLPQGSYICP